MIVFLIGLFGFVLSLFFLARECLYRKRRIYRQKHDGKTIIGIFHPYCNAGGGGERVLWCTVRAIQSQYPHCRIVIYTGDEIPAEKMIDNARQRFNVEISAGVGFIYLSSRWFVEATTYPRFTLMGQSLGSMVLGFEALFKLNPDIYIDTMGYSFTYPLFRFLGQCKIACYVHYPTISTDMLGRVSQRTSAFNNNSTIAHSSVLSWFKLQYYKLFAAIYAMTGRCADSVMVNSSWTEDHINQIWNISERTFKIYPPCDVQEFLQIAVDSEPETFRIVAVAQFRPEKDHPLMIRSFHTLLENISDEEREKVKLVLVGSCRHSEDFKRVDDYKRLCKHFNMEDHVEFHLNVEFEQLKNLLQKSTIGLHAMWNEHFGISIVECMAAGLIMVAHKSGGPLADIIIRDGSTRTPIGYLATDEFEYAEILTHVIRMSAERRQQIRHGARQSVSRFSDQVFQQELLRVISLVIENP